MQSPQKIVETEAIFTHVYTADRLADELDGILRISIDTKANVISRRG